MKQKKILMLIATVLVVVLGASVLTACNKDKGNGGGSEGGKVSTPGTGWEDPKMYTMRDYTTQMPSQWCTILSIDAVDSDMEGYLMSNFYEFNYKFDANGNIVSGAYTVDYSAATELKDVTAKYAGKYGIAEGKTKGHAFAMTLRNDLKWDDGTPIKAADFVYTMTQQLSPNYLFGTASNYYSGNYIIHNAQNYVKQGQKGWFSAVDVEGYGDNISSFDGLYFDATNVKAFDDIFGNADMTKLASLKDYFAVGDTNVYDELVGYAGEKRTPMTKTIADKLASLFGENGQLGAYWNWADSEIGYFSVVNYTYPTMDFSEVGYFVGENEYELVMVTDKALYPINDDGTLNYQAGYYFSSWPLVKRNLWEIGENRADGVPYKNSYCTTTASSASWGPYKLTNYQDQKTYTLSRNEKWFGYGLEQYATQYQTDEIVTEKIPEWDTAWMAFQQGKLDSISMNVKIAADYRTSKRAFFTPSTATASLNIQSKAVSRSESRNNLLLNYADFRKAISLSLDRDDFCAKNSPSSKAALGLLNSMYYYDVENGKIYRDSIQAKEALLNAYGATKNKDGSWKVGEYSYTDIDEALDAMTGYNLTLARQLVNDAVTQAIKDGNYTEGEEIVLTYGIETQNTDTDRVKNWFQSAFDNMTKGTKIEGKIKIEYFIFSAAEWSDQFINGEYDLCFGAWQNAPFNPAYLLCETQISDDNRFAMGWDPTTVSVTVKATPDANHKDGVYTYNLEQWRLILQGKEGCPVDFTGFSIEDQLTALGAVETAILNAYYSIPVYSRFSASLMGYKTDYVSYEYNTFMGYGGIRYMTFNYDDDAWAEFVKSNNNMLNYK